MEFLRRQLRHLFPNHRWHVGIWVGEADEIPSRIPSFTAVVVGTQADPKWLAFNCPCGTGHQIMLNLDPRRSPTWTFSSARRLTIKPSVDSVRPERHCHYLVHQGKIRWVNDNWRHGNV